MTERNAERSKHKQRNRAAIANDIKRRRHAAGLTQPEFAAQLGVSTATIGNWETAHRLPGPAIYKVLCDRFPAGPPMRYHWGRPNPVPGSEGEQWAVAIRDAKADSMDGVPRAVYRVKPNATDPSYFRVITPKQLYWFKWNAQRKGWNLYYYGTYMLGDRVDRPEPASANV